MSVRLSFDSKHQQQEHMSQGSSAMNRMMMEASKVINIHKSVSIIYAKLLSAHR